MLTGVVQRNR